MNGRVGVDNSIIHFDGGKMTKINNDHQPVVMVSLELKKEVKSNQNPVNHNHSDC